MADTPKNENSSDQNTSNSPGNGTGNGSATESLDSVPQKTELEVAADEIQKWKNEFLYLRAEFDNFKKHTIKERSDLLKFGAERVARDILEVMDNFERALQTKLTSENLQTYKTGVEMTAKELKEALSKHGIQEVPSEGLPFNPMVHEAISSEQTNTIADGHITKVFKKPYKLHDKIIRLGQVVVATPIKQ